MAIRHLTPWEREYMVRLAKHGKSVTDISVMLGRRWNTVNEVLRAAGVTSPGRRPENPISNYDPPPADEDELTPLQREERAVSLARAFEERVDHEMTISSAKADLSMSSADLAAREGITMEQARWRQARGFEFLKRLHLAKQKEKCNAD